MHVQMLVVEEWWALPLTQKVWAQTNLKSKYRYLKKVSKADTQHSYN